MKLSNKILIAFFSLIFILTIVTMVEIHNLEKDYFNDRISGNQKWTSAEYSILDFHTLEVGGHFVVRWHKGSPKLIVKIEESLKPYFRIKQDSDKLSFNMDSLETYRSNGNIEVDIYSENLRALKLSDFMQFSSKDTLNSGTLSFEFEDHVEVDLLVQTDSLELNLFDFSQLKLKGSSKVTNADLNGHTELDAFDFSMQNAFIHMDDFSKAELLVLNYLKAECQDHAILNYKGSTVTAEINQRNFSEVTKEN
ncbi:MAG: DUF2807 domain-containing protein [Saprospiraceae bacterium]|nr:DUF2807 domain-containing protein [Saprospiraceae bacterium]MBK9220753.1 DUF2807 domain-containing protein [Saprospiraceae bacterium]MBK9722402.1 DUF2807 domain-containing protein [Saprospiraceae bacterium]MBK9729426.1 DUF2807 domain-containing protein [Saprospiraceae bacterium]